MEEKIIAYLKEKYEPTGILLYGSRVYEKTSPESDWDLFVFSDKEETEIDDFGQLREFEGEALEVSVYPTKVDSGFILETAMHPVREVKILFDISNGLMQQIVQNTLLAYTKNPLPINQQKKELYRKILNKFIRKVASRPDNIPYSYFSFGQFYTYAIRYWFEQHCEWPLPIYEAGEYIKNKDEKFFGLLQVIHSPAQGTSEKLVAARMIRDTLFPSPSIN